MTATTSIPTSTPTSSPTPPAPARKIAGNPGVRQGRRIIGRVLACVSIAACGVWAFMPLGRAQVDVPRISPSAAAAGQPAQVALDLAAFNAPVWVAPAAPSPPPPALAEAPPPPPLKWQLLAIVREDTGDRALVYDPDSDRLLVLREGDESGPRRVERVTATTLDVRGGVGVRTIALRDAAGGRP
jgi:hypothetical protein